MADVTPAAQELADEKGVDLDSVEGTGKDGRILVEDVEAALEAKEESAEEAPAEADELTEPESAEKSVDAYLEHPHVPLEDQSPEELKDFSPDSLESAGVLDAEKADEEEAPPANDEESAEAVGNAQEEGDSDEPDPSLLLSQDDILNRGLRERGFYVIPDQVNPYAPRDVEEEEAPPADASADRPLGQEGVVDTSAAGLAPTAGESLKEKAPAVSDFAEAGGPGTSEAGGGSAKVYEADDPKNQSKDEE